MREYIDALYVFLIEQETGERVAAGRHVPNFRASDWRPDVTDDDLTDALARMAAHAWHRRNPTAYKDS